MKPHVTWERTLTNAFRMVPDFLIIGAQRCGTTSLYDCLVQHPCVAPALKKEVHFFDKNFSKGWGWYRAHFPVSLHQCLKRRSGRQAVVAGEASPYYVFHPHAPRRIAQALPGVKLILLLRNPVNRACSHYYHEVKKGVEKLSSFEQALEQEEKRLAGELDKMLQDEWHVSFNHQHYSYRARGRYLDQLTLWMRVFPKEQFLILKSEEFYQDPTHTFKRVLGFLRLPLWEPPAFPIPNAGRYPAMNPTTRGHLAKYFRPHNERLYDLLGVDFGWDD